MDDLERAGAAHMLGATARPDLQAKARALVEDDDDLALLDDAGRAGVLGDALHGVPLVERGSTALPKKKTPGGIVPMGVRPDRGRGPLGSAGAATLAEMDSALSDLNAWNDRRRREEQRARETLAGDADAGDGAAGDGDGDDGAVAIAAVGKIAADVDAELAALDAELEEAMKGFRRARETTPSAAFLRAGGGEDKDGRNETDAGAPSARAHDRRRPTSAAARRPLGGFPLRDVGPAIGTGVFGLQEGMHAASSVGGASFGGGEPGTREGDDGEEEGDAFASTLSSWTQDVDAVLSKIDACEEVGRAKGEFFKEQR